MQIYRFTEKNLSFSGVSCHLAGKAVDCDKVEHMAAADRVVILPENEASFHPVINTSFTEPCSANDDESMLS